jgi:hypothetical protein
MVAGVHMLGSLWQITPSWPHATACYLGDMQSCNKTCVWLDPCQQVGWEALLHLLQANFMDAPLASLQNTNMPLYLALQLAGQLCLLPQLLLQLLQLLCGC